MEWICDALAQRTYEIDASTSSVPLVPQQESIAIPEEVRIRNDCNLNALKHILQVPSEAPDDSILQICKVFRLTSLQKVATPRDRPAAGKRIKRVLKYRSKALVAHPERDSASVFRDKGVNVRISRPFPVTLVLAYIFALQQNKIFIRGLPGCASREELREYFGKAGQIVDVQLMCVVVLSCIGNNDTDAFIKVQRLETRILCVFHLP